MFGFVEENGNIKYKNNWHLYPELPQYIARFKYKFTVLK
jgi:hypothetical protein